MLGESNVASNPSAESSQFSCRFDILGQSMVDGGSDA